MYFTYVLYNKSFNKFYVGYTKNLNRRLDEHENIKGKDYKLAYYEACLSRKDARKRELQLKTGFGR